MAFDCDSLSSFLYKSKKAFPFDFLKNWPLKSWIFKYLSCKLKCTYMSFDLKHVKTLNTVTFRKRKQQRKYWLKSDFWRPCVPIGENEFRRIQNIFNIYISSLSMKFNRKWFKIRTKKFGLWIFWENTGKTIKKPYFPRMAKKYLNAFFSNKKLFSLVEQSECRHRSELVALLFKF